MNDYSSRMGIGLLVLAVLASPLEGMARAADSGDREILYWVAPMDPNYRRDKPGKSPMGMDLVPVYKEQKKARKILYWVAPMDPNYRRDKPGKSPMGMDLIPVYAEEGGEQGAGVTIPPEVIQNLGVRTTPARRATLKREIDTVGYVDYDESRVSHIHLRTQGWIERLVVQSEGERVRKGERLFNLYSPELVNAQDEFIQALKVGNQGLIRASRDRLKALGISQDQIKRLQRERRARQTIRVYAPQDGVVSNLPVRDGMFVKPAQQVMQIGDLSTVWLLAEVFERQSAWVKVGDSAEVRLPFLPGRVWRGQVEYIYPDLDPKTRTLKVRLRFDNPDEALKPNMYADVKLLTSPRRNALVIPTQGLIRTGSEARVIVAKGKGHFEARQVRAGIESGDRVEILEGLEAGDQVVVSGQFLIDSEASLKASLMRMSEPPKAVKQPSARPGSQSMAMPKAKAETEPAPPKGVVGHGVINRLQAAEHKINLTHEPIPALGWPAMTMDFKLGEGVRPGKLKVGERVEFELQGQGNTLHISKIQRASE